MAPSMATMSMRSITPCASVARPIRVAPRIQATPKQQKVEISFVDVAQKVTAAVLVGVMIASPVLALDKRAICAGNPTAKICLKDSAKQS